MFVLLNLLALAATAAVAYVGAVQGFYRAAMTLVACLLAGAAAFGLFAPAAGLLDSGSPNSTWYYAADALALWAIFSLTFLALRTAGEKVLRIQPPFSPRAEFVGGAALGAITGYLAVGVCLVLVQMLPLPPQILGYAPFRYDRDTGAVRPGDGLWLAWDRGTLALFAYFSGGPLGGDEHRLFRRYGNVYPPGADPAAEPDLSADRSAVALAKAEARSAKADADDMLYRHWLRRWEFIKWRTGRAQGPLHPDERAAPAETETARRLPGVALRAGQRIADGDLILRIARIERTGRLADFDAETPPQGCVLLVLTLDLSPGAAVPVNIDTRRGVLLAENGRRYGDPKVYGPARLGTAGLEILHVTPRPPRDLAARNLRFGVPENKTRGHYLADGAVLHFTDQAQEEQLDLVYTLPADLADNELRFLFDPAPPAAPSAPGPAAP
jgi:uncharacterized membrane protein required for colicin V production